MHLHCALIAHSFCKPHENETQNLILPTKLHFQVAGF
jgi:hypothetical protein